MVDCLPIFQSGNKGCGGGFLDSVGSYASANGISQEKAYPYTAAQGTCNLDRINAGPTFSINSYVYIYDCVALANALLTLKPIGVCGDIDAQWQSYVSGVIPNCNSTYLGGHCVLLVGATSDGTSNVNNNYWKIKNSWGKTFGEAGFMRLYRDSTDILSGFCKICTEGIYSV
jgi:cathepsin L